MKEYTGEAAWQKPPCVRCGAKHPAHCPDCPNDPPCADHVCSWQDDGMDFSDALLALKDGKKVKREAWPVQAPGALAYLYVYLDEREGYTTELMVMREDGVRSVFPLTGWFLLAEDWEIV